MDNASRPDRLDVEKMVGTNRPAAREGRLQAGSMLGQYRVMRLLGKGGMGEVYEVEHL